MCSKSVLVLILTSTLLASVGTGCKSLFPRNSKRAEAVWQSFEDAQQAYEKIIPGQTTEAELKELGFDPFVTPNVKILTYLDIIERFMPNASISKEDLHQAVRLCLDNKDHSKAYELELNNLKDKRYGNLMLDVLGFRRQTKTTGWNFKALLLLNDTVVVYKLRSGQPEIERYEDKVNPLGPFQDLDHVLSGAVRSAAK